MSADNKPQKSTVIDVREAIFDKIFKENQELRDHNQELVRTLSNFKELARVREAQHKRFENLEESILKAVDLNNMIHELRKKLTAEFTIPIANISLIESVKNTIGLEVQEILEPSDKDQENNLSSTITFISKPDYDRLFPQHRPLISAHPDPILLALFEPLDQTNKIASSAFVPIISRNRAIGILDLASPDPQKFSPGAATDAVESLSRKLATVIENSLLMAQLQKLLRTDQLTSLYNRRTLDEILPIEFARAQRYSRPLSLIMIDLDDFKLVNDHYGHPVGDQVLAETGSLISNNLRQHDIGLRYGGDEFTIILPDTNHQQGRTIITKLMKIAMATKIQIEPDTHLSIQLTAGLATYLDGPAADAEALKKAADKDLYRNKEKKKRKSSEID